jgi:hypothetical protein
LMGFRSDRSSQSVSGGVDISWGALKTGDAWGKF